MTPTPTDWPGHLSARARLALSIAHLEQELAMPRTDFVPTSRGRRGKGLRTKSAKLRAERRQAQITSRTRKPKESEA